MVEKSFPRQSRDVMEFELLRREAVERINPITMENPDAKYRRPFAH
jgi:hypothetical protein